MKQIPVLKHAPYTLDLAPLDFMMFPKITDPVNVYHFESVEDMQSNATTFPRELSENVL